MAKVVVQSHVEDADAWKRVFDENLEVRTGHGATGHTINRTLEDPNSLLVVISFDSAESAKGFVNDPALRGRMDKAGVNAAPQMWVVEEIEEVSY